MTASFVSDRTHVTYLLDRVTQEQFYELVLQGYRHPPHGLVLTPVSADVFDMLTEVISPQRQLVGD